MTIFSKALSFVVLVFLPLQACGQEKANKNMESSSNTSSISLLKAVSDKDATLVSEILKTRPNLEIKDHKGRTALMIATYQDDHHMAKILISAGADVNSQDDLLNSPHLYAGANGNLEILKMTLTHGAKFNIYNRYGGTALIPAAERLHLDIVKTLIETPEYPIEHINNLGWTALLEAIILGSRNKTQLAIVKILVAAGADVNIADNEGITPLQHAKNRNLDAIVQILMEAKAR